MIENLTEYQNTCRNMYKLGNYDMKYINEGFVDFELDKYIPLIPRGKFEGTLKIYLNHMTTSAYLSQTFDSRRSDRRRFEADKKKDFEERNVVMAHNNRCLSIIEDFYNDTPEADFERRKKLFNKINEFKNVIDSMPIYQEPKVKKW